MIIIGCDWARCKHDFLLMNGQGKILLRTSIEHDAQALDELAETIAKFESVSAEVRVGIESHDGPMPTWLLSRGYTVYPINPKSAERARDIYRPAGGKDDKTDAFVLAEIVRNDAGHLRALRAHSQLTQQLHGWVRLRDAHVRRKTADAQRLRGLLDAWNPPLSALLDDFNRIWQRDLLKQFPLHQDLACAHGNRLRAFCKAHRLTAKTRERIQDVKDQQVMPIPAGRLAALRAEISFLAESIHRSARAIAEAETEMARLIARHDDAAIFQSLPVKGTATVAALLAAFGEDRETHLTWRQLAARWGVAPVTAASGKSRRVKRRRAHDGLIYRALIFFAFNTAVSPSCWASEYYREKRSRGLGHHAALRCLAQRWVKILYRIWKDRLLYVEQRHQNNRLTRTGAAARQSSQQSA